MAKRDLYFIHMYFSDNECRFFNRFEYEVIAAHGIVDLNEPTQIDFQWSTEHTSIQMKFDEVARTLHSPTKFTVGVRIKSGTGHRSSFSRTKVIEIQPAQATICSTNDYQFWCYI